MGVKGEKWIAGMPINVLRATKLGKVTINTRTREAKVEEKLRLAEKGRLFRILVAAPINFTCVILL